MTPKPIVDEIRRDTSPELHDEIRRLWKAHSIAEDRRDIPGLLATLTEDCVYETPQTGETWHGHAGATRFYEELLGAFPDIRFDLERIVIGPQGVFEEARATGTRTGLWRGLEPDGRAVEFRVLILFPWDPEKRKFRGERVYTFGME